MGSALAGERWQEIDRIFATAVDLPPEVRRAWLDEQCAGDRDLEEAVLRLLESDRRAGEFLARPWSLGKLSLPVILPVGAAPSSAPPFAEPVDERGRRIGAYRLVEPISHGGMGSVYLAQRDDDHFRRRVAVKLVRRGALEEELYPRFRLERQILAGLEHPYIARLYEGARTEDGRPYLVMEYVEGLPIDQYCDERALGVEERIELFRKVCSAVHYAHQNLLVHRDLKPDNILVTPEGAPKLLDFGIAKPLQPGSVPEDLTTAVGLRPMTPGYASPEQVLGKVVSTASDVYSLGVLLYALLTGSRPYQPEPGGLHQLERAICGQPPIPPSQAAAKRAGDFAGLPARELARRLRGDLDTILLMALRKEPERRYGSASQLADDLKLHLEDKPVSARADTLGYRWGRFLRRHRLGVAAAAGTLLVILAMAAYVTVTSTRQARHMALEKERTEQAMTYLVEVLKATDPKQTGRGARSPLEVLDDGTRQVTQRFAGNPQMQATLFEALGQVYTSLGHLQRAEPLLARALALRRQHFQPGDPELTASLVHLGEVRTRAGKTQEAMALYREVLAALELKGETRGSTIYDVRQRLARATLESGDLDAAVRLQRRSLAVLRGDPAADPLELTRAMNDLGSTLQLYSDLREAEALHREALEIETALLPDDHLALADTREQLALTLIGFGRYAEAETLLRECLAAREKALDLEHPELAQGINHLAISLFYQRRFGEAEALYRRSLAMAGNRLGPRHPQTATSLHNLAMFQLTVGQLEPAEESFRKAVSIFREVLGDDHPRTARSTAGLAFVLRRLGHGDQARELLDSALPGLEGAYGEGGLALAHISLDLGRLMMVGRDFAAAEELLATALALRRESLDPKHWKVAEAKGAYGACLAHLGRGEQARSLLEEARPGVLRQFGPEDHRIRSIDATLASLRRR